MEKTILQVSFLGTRACTHAVLPHINNSASIVSTGHAWRDGAPQVKCFAAITDARQLADFVADENIDATRAYNLTKETMILWTIAETDAVLNHGLRINSLSPGVISTGTLGDFQKAFGAHIAKNVARAGRPGSPTEIAEIADFLLSPASNWIKGADIAIDGGMDAFNQSDVMDLGSLHL